MCTLLKSLDTRFYEFYFVIAETDTKSKDMCLQKLKDWNGWKQNEQFYYIPRSREVYQSFFTSIFTTLKAFIYSALFTLPKINPDLVKKVFFNWFYKTFRF